jgi:acetyl esterase/lipase
MKERKRYRALFLISSLFFYTAMIAQSTAGLTGKPDTSFNTNAEYLKQKKYFPAIKIVPEFHSSSIREKHGLVYCKMGSRKLHVDAFYPKQKKKRNGAAIMIIYGGGWRSGSRMQHYPLAEKLAQLGYVCFTPEYRLSTEALYPAAVYDLKAAMRWIHKHSHQYSINENKIAVMGFSAGGELSAFLGTTQGNPTFEGRLCNVSSVAKISAVVDLDGTLSFVHPESGEGDDSKRTSAATYWFGYSKKENPDLWTAASPLTYAGKNTPPTVFINSSVDRMHAGREDYIKILHQNNIYTEVHSFPNSPHSFPLFYPWFDPMVQYTNEFLQKVFFQK